MSLATTVSKFDLSFISKFGVSKDNLAVGVFPGVLRFERGLKILSLGYGVILKSLDSHCLFWSFEFYWKSITNFLDF